MSSLKPFTVTFCDYDCDGTFFSDTHVMARDADHAYVVATTIGEDMGYTMSRTFYGPNGVHQYGASNVAPENLLEVNFSYRYFSKASGDCYVRTEEGHKKNHPVLAPWAEDDSRGTILDHTMEDDVTSVFDHPEW